MYDISLERFNDEFGFLTFPSRSNATSQTKLYSHQ